MTDYVVNSTFGSNSGSLFAAYGGSTDGYVSPDLATATGAPFSSLGTASPTSVNGLPLGCIAIMGVGGGSNPNQICVALQGTLTQDTFTAFKFLDGSSVLHTYLTANASFNDPRASATGWSVWLLNPDDPGGTSPATGVSNFTFSFPVTVTLSTPTVYGATNVALAWTPAGLGSLTVTSYDLYRDGAVLASFTAGTTSYVDETSQTSTTFDYQVVMHLSDGSSVSSSVQAATTDSATVEFNGDCQPISPYDTLLNVRKRMLIRLGYPNQVNNPPPGMASLIDEYLRSAQREIYRQVQRASRRTERFYRWTMRPGLRYYGLDASEDNCGGYTIDPEKITWVGFEDLNKAWYRLDDGIPPEYYTRANINFGWPTRFEIRQYIEIFPAPQAAYTLWVKGDFGLAPLVDDTDQFTIDDEAVFLLALGNAKSDRGAKDAQLVLNQAGNYIKGIVAGTHGTKRYVPRSQDLNPLTPPKFLPLGDGQA